MPKQTKKASDDPFDIKPDCLFFSDLHLHDRQEFGRVDPDTGLGTRLLEGLNILKQIRTILNDHQEINYVYHLGDVFELKDRVPNHVLIEFKKQLRNILKYSQFYSLMGNHDFNLPDYPLLSVFETDKNFHFLNKPTVFFGNTKSIIYIVPFQRNWEDFKWEWIVAHETKPKPQVILLHQEIPGGAYETGKVVPGHFDLKVDPNILYLSGHLHRPQKVGPIQYLGSPYQTKFTNDNGERYIWLYNSRSRELRPLKLEYSKFISVGYYDFGFPRKDTWWDTIANGNYIRIVGEVEKENFDPDSKKKISVALEKAGAKAVVFNIKIKRQEQIEIQNDLIDDRSVIQKYAEEHHGDLSSSALIKVGVDIYESL